MCGIFHFGVMSWCPLFTNMPQGELIMSEVFQTILGICLLLVLGLALVGQVVFTQAIGWCLVFLVLPFIVLTELCQFLSYSFKFIKKKLLKR